MTDPAVIPNFTDWPTGEISWWINTHPFILHIQSIGVKLNIENCPPDIQSALYTIRLRNAFVPDWDQDPTYNLRSSRP